MLMPQLLQRFDFVIESSSKPSFVGHMRGDQFDRYLLTGLLVDGGENRPHAAATKRFP